MPPDGNRDVLDLSLLGGTKKAAGKQKHRPNQNLGYGHRIDPPSFGSWPLDQTEERPQFKRRGCLGLASGVLRSDG